MITRIWQAIESLFCRRRDQPLPIIKKVERKQRFLTIEDPYAPKSRVSRTTDTKGQKTTLPTPKNAQQLMNLYKIYQKFEQDLTQSPQQQQQDLQNDKFFLDLREMDDTLKQIQQKQQYILDNSHQLMQEISGMLYKIAEVNECEKEERQLYRKYVKIVQETIEIKYSGELKDYPEISYEKFKQIHAIWNISQKNGQSTVSGYDHLRYCHLRLLGPGRWLNDQIISEYINLINAKLAQKQGNNYLIFNSLKVTSLFDKADYKKLEKVLQRQKVTRNTTLLLAIHKVNHWLFVKMQNTLISIYDSMVSSNINTYINFPLINKIIKFAQYYYGNFPEIQKIGNFPQQTNGHDCGMMMLCGMKDLVRDLRGWSFTQNDIMYKRVLVTKELLDKQIVGF